MISSMDGLSYAERLRCLNLWSLEERRKRQDLTEVFKMSERTLIIELQDLLTLDKNNNKQEAN